MTDKEIIIDGVDVSECEYSFKQFDNWIGKDVVMCDCTLGCRCEPKENHCKFYMYYLEQQLKRKEQECEELKEDRERWKSNFNGKVSAIEELLQQLDQFKVKDIKNSKTLTEIKEIAEKQVKRSPDGETFSRPEIKQILQKISEVV